jgi:hypothetical protein
MHTMTVALDINTPRYVQNSRLAWVLSPKEYLKTASSNYEGYGIYMFGGLDGKTGKASDDLYLIQP